MSVLKLYCTVCIPIIIQRFVDNVKYPLQTWLTLKFVALTTHLKMLQYAGNVTYMYSYQSTFHVQVNMTVNQTVKKYQKCNYLIYTSNLCMYVVLNQVYSVVQVEISWVPTRCGAEEFLFCSQLKMYQQLATLSATDHDFPVTVTFHKTSLDLAPSI